MKRSAKRANSVKYKNFEKEVLKEENKEEKPVSTSNHNFFETLAKQEEELAEKETITPTEKEHLTENRINLNKELIRRWFNVEKKGE